MYNLSKKNILAKLDQVKAFNFYLKPYHKFEQLSQGKNISNPFLPDKQETPSFNIYTSNKNGEWKFKDFATDDQGNIFDLVMRLSNCDFIQSLHIINNDFSLGLNNSKNEILKIEFKQWNHNELRYWNDYGISTDTLEKYYVKPLVYYKSINKQGKEYTVKTTIDNPIFAYKINSHCYKIYKPLDKKYKFSWLGEKPSDLIFGYDQLPNEGDRVFITGGEKDVISLYAHNESAITLNSEIAHLPEELFNELKSRFKEIIVLYDIDSTGKNQSDKLARKHKMCQIILPSKLKEKGGKDISDFYKMGFNLNDNEVKLIDFSENNSSKNLLKILETQKLLNQRKSETMIKPVSILNQLDNEIIFPNTINIIQGKAGVHKSRLAETICSSLICKTSSQNDFLGFTKSINQLTVCYIDTERNLTYQFPYSIQQILLNAGYEKNDNPISFEYVSLLEISRDERFETLTNYINYIRNKISGHIIIILDVITDCIRDFNRPEDSMGLIDLMNMSINKDNVTYICLIHENPGSIDKARGHLGTELMNKASTVIQVEFEKGKNGKPTELILLNFLKTRTTKRLESIHLKYCLEKNGLIIASESFVNETIQSRRQKAEINEIIKSLEQLLIESMPNRQLIELLRKQFQCSDKLIRERLKEIINEKKQLINQKNKHCLLNSIRRGKETYYNLTPIASN